VNRLRTFNRHWYILNAENLPLGRLAAQAATILQGKIHAAFLLNFDCGDYVIVLNCEKIVLTGKKIENKSRYRHTGYVGHLKKTNYSELMPNHPETAVKLAIKGMMPQSSLGRKQMTRLFVTVGNDHPYKSQKLRVWDSFRKVRRICHGV
jgi:large subunit ribosomal protein L13